jgi:hypothetical protein
MKIPELCRYWVLLKTTENLEDTAENFDNIENWKMLPEDTYFSQIPQ